MPTHPSSCSHCGRPLTNPGDGDLCPKCLMKIGLEEGATLPMSAGVPEAGGGGERKFGPYRILRLLGKGGMGSVYEAEENSSGLRIALKVLGHSLDTPELRGRFLREGRLAASVRHPNVVGVISAGEVDGTPVIAMELLHDGTLAERVKKHGPMSPEDAVNAALGIIDGLEAAHAAGVLHRDVKPANCFMSADGHVKVGDFGLSMSTLARTENSLTLSGAVLGTPAFAAPEQLRGEDIDVRADIYAVGATLYYLLTGRSTHAADTLVAMIAAVLTKTPSSPSALRPEIPTALSRVVMRCLDRSRSQRYPDYAALRAALERFRSGAPSPGMLGLRGIAGVVDVFLSSTPALLAMAWTGSDVWPIRGGGASLALWLAGYAFQILYFTAIEGRWGATPGKLLCGLRVSKAAGGHPGYRQTLARAAIFISPEIVVALLLFGSMTWQASPPAWGEDLPRVILFLCLCLTMRRANGFAMLQDVLTGTRVAAVPSPENDISILSRETPMPPATGSERIGPFVVCQRHAGFVEAWDSTLGRSVWIVMRAAGFPELPPRRRGLNRSGRLQWLQGVRGSEANWDAFEAPAGQPFFALADRKQPWNRVRRWLSDLAEEFASSSRDGTRPDEIGFSQVWVTSHGRAIWLDFSLPEKMERFSINSPGEFQRFLAHIAAETLAESPPLHAVRLVRTLEEERLETPEMIAGNLRAVLEYPATITRRKRLVTLLLWPLLALAFSLVSALSIMPEDAEKGAPQHEITIEVRTQPSTIQDSPTATRAERVETLIDNTLGSKPFLITFSFSAFMIFGGFASVLWTLVTSVPPGLHLHGLVLVTRSGSIAPRWIAVIRSALAGLVTALLVSGMIFLAATHATGIAWLLIPTLLGSLLVLGIALHAFLSPRRALADILLGTTIVPR